MDNDKGAHRNELLNAKKKFFSLFYIIVNKNTLLRLEDCENALSQTVQTCGR